MGVEDSAKNILRLITQPLFSVLLGTRNLFIFWEIEIHPSTWNFHFGINFSGIYTLLFYLLWELGIYLFLLHFWESEFIFFWNLEFFIFFLEFGIFHLLGTWNLFLGILNLLLLGTWKFLTLGIKIYLLGELGIYLFLFHFGNLNSSLEFGIFKPRDLFNFNFNIQNSTQTYKYRLPTHINAYQLSTHTYIIYHIYTLHRTHRIIHQ